MRISYTLAIFLIITGIIFSIIYISVTPTGFVTFKSIDSCQDSDFGINYQIKGKTIVKSHSAFSLSSELIEHEDYCRDENTLIEYSCEKKGTDQKEKINVFYCSGKCDDGKCFDIKKRPNFKIIPISAIIIIIMSIMIIIGYLEKKEKRIKRKKKNK